MSKANPTFDEMALPADDPQMRSMEIKTKTDDSKTLQVEQNPLATDATTPKSLCRIAKYSQSQ